MHIPDIPPPPKKIFSASVVIVLFALAMGGFAIGTTEFATMSLLPYFAPDLGISEAKAANVISAYALGVVVGAPLLAIIGARQSRQKMLIWLMLAFAAFNALSALAPNYPLMLVARFMSGLPHGAYFGVVSLVAASLVPPHKRATAVARAMMGLMIATIIGVPLANILGQFFGWRFGFFLVAVLAICTSFLIWRFVPHDTSHKKTNLLQELHGLRNRHIWLTLLIGAIGSGGLFAVYTYVASVLITVTGSGEQSVPVVLSIFGFGMTIGTLITSRLADKFGSMKAARYSLLWSALSLCIYPFATEQYWSMCVMAFFIGNVGGLGTALQIRLMDVAKDAQMVSAALNHSAFNVANALGPLLAGYALTLGWGFPSSGFVGCALAVGGLVIWFIAARTK